MRGHWRCQADPSTESSSVEARVLADAVSECVVWPVFLSSTSDLVATESLPMPHIFKQRSGHTAFEFACVLHQAEVCLLRGRVFHTHTCSQSSAVYRQPCLRQYNQFDCSDRDLLAPPAAIPSSFSFSPSILWSNPGWFSRPGLP